MTIRRKSGVFAVLAASVLLTGGCFQNRVLTERAVWGLRTAGFRPYLARELPPNDGGVAVGQLIAALEASGNEGPLSSR